MSGGEKMNRESMDRQTRHVSDVQRFESMSAEELDTKLHIAETTTVDRWENCNRSFKLLFDTLNSGIAGQIDRFDIKTDEVTYGSSTYERYIRIWKDKRDDAYKCRPKMRVDGIIEDQDFEETESFGSTYEYKFGTTHSHTATVKMLDITGGGVKLERQDGMLVAGLTQHECAVLVSAMEGMILPSIAKAEDTLITIWQAVVDEELNPIHAASVLKFYSKKN